MLAVASYLRKTDKQTIHFMSSCQWKLAKTPIYVTAVDQDVKLLVHETVTMLRNGFFELWPPRKRIIDLSIQGLNLSAQVKLQPLISVKPMSRRFSYDNKPAGDRQRELMKRTDVTNLSDTYLLSTFLWFCPQGQHAKRRLPTTNSAKVLLTAYS